MKTDLIPHPDNPGHVENLNMIAKLEAQGFHGADASLAESIFAYGMAWREIGNQTLFVHRNPHVPKRFDRTSFDSNLDLKREFNWVNWDTFMSFLGAQFDEWDKLPLGQKILDLVAYYGTEEIFGASYWEGFSISQD